MFDSQKQKQLRPTEIHRAGVDLAAIRGESPAAQDDAERVRAALELFSDIMRDVESALVILGESRGENGIADFCAVEIKLGRTETGVADRGALDLFLHGKFLAQPPRRKTSVFRRARLAPRLHPYRAEGFSCGPL